MNIQGLNGEMKAYFKRTNHLPVWGVKKLGCIVLFDCDPHIWPSIRNKLFPCCPFLNWIRSDRSRIFTPLSYLSPSLPCSFGHACPRTLKFRIWHSIGLIRKANLSCWKGIQRNEIRLFWKVKFFTSIVREILRICAWLYKACLVWWRWASATSSGD